MADEKDPNGEEQEITVTLVLDDDTEVGCVVLTILNVEEHEYTVPLPMEGADSEEGGVYLYRYSETKGEIPNSDNIEDDDEYEIVAKTLDGLLDAQEYDELVGKVGEE